MKKKSFTVLSVMLCLLSTSVGATEQVPHPQQSTPNVVEEGKVKAVEKGAEQELTFDQKQTIVKDKLVDRILSTNAPLTPDQIILIKEIIFNRKKAEAYQAGPPPRAVSRAIEYDLSPGATPPVIRVSSRAGVNIIFRDSQGEPWPIVDNVIQNFVPTIFKIVAPIKQGAILQIGMQPNKYYGNGNATILLYGLDTPIIFDMIAGQEETDYRVDIEIPGFSPRTKIKQEAQSFGEARPEHDPILIDILAKRFDLHKNLTPITLTFRSGGENVKLQKTLGWIDTSKQRVYLRTKDTLLSPGYLDTQKSIDGTRAYALDIKPVIIMSHNGEEYAIELGL